MVSDDELDAIAERLAEFLVPRVILAQLLARDDADEILDAISKLAGEPDENPEAFALFTVWCAEAN